MEIVKTCQTQYRTNAPVSISSTLAEMLSSLSLVVWWKPSANKQLGALPLDPCIGLSRSALAFFFLFHFSYSPQADVMQLVGWSLTSLFSTNMTISETRGHAVCRQTAHLLASAKPACN